MSIIKINITFLKKHPWDKWKLLAALKIVLWLKQKIPLSPKQLSGLQWGEIIFFCSQALKNRYSLWQEHIQTLPCLNISFSGFTVHQRKYSAFFAGIMAELPLLIIHLEKINYWSKDGRKSIAQLQFQLLNRWKQDNLKSSTYSYWECF